MLKVFLDASVIIAAILSPSGGSAKLMQLISLKQVIGITTQTVVEEIIEHSSKIDKTVEEIIKFIANHGILVRKKVTGTESERFRDTVDPDDAHLIAGSLLTKCQCLVTLDRKHLLRQDIRAKVKPLKIVEPGDILKDLVS